MPHFPTTERLNAAWEFERSIHKEIGATLEPDHFMWLMQSRWIHQRVANLDLSPEEVSWAGLSTLPCDTCCQPAWVDRFASIDQRLRRRCTDCWVAFQRKRARDDSKAHRDRNRQPKPQQPCAHCGELFQPLRSTAKFCSAKCRVYASRQSPWA
jgi:hypothetical protein